MNEQIKAIGHQAGLVFIEDGVYGQRWYSSKCGLDVSEYQKLVELIVAECVEQGKLSQSQTVVNGSEEYNSGREMGIEVFMNQIKKHFGVEP